MKRFAAALAWLVSTIPLTAAAQQIEIRPAAATANRCRHRCVKLLDRLSFTSSFGVTLQDEFDRSLWIGNQLNYRFNDVVSLGVWAGFAVTHVPTALTNAVRQQTAFGGSMPTPTSPSPMPNVNSTPNIPLGEQFNRQVGQIDWMISAPQITVYPFRGKLLLAQQVVFEAEFFLFAGPALVGVTERADYDVGQRGPMFVGTGGLIEGQLARQSRIALTGTFGAGFDFFLARFVSLGVEYRAFPFAWNTSGFDANSVSQRCGVAADRSCAGSPDYLVPRDTSGTRDVGGRFIVNSDDQLFHWNHMVNFSLTFLLPVGPQRGGS